MLMTLVQLCQLPHTIS
nr:unnamed protein product [Callosobruchus analis]CAI5829767.1 unnamed protein product [Callosobruchus analis]CAI5829803.1 unnamed protein product [Callosobruchus analis]CAI5851440.1 unnamed protein product [Callosobruchus analis]